MRAQVGRAYPFGLHEDQRGGRACCTQKRARAPQPLPNCTGPSGRLNGDQTLPRWSGLKIQAITPALTPTQPRAATQNVGRTRNIVPMTKFSSMSPNALFKPTSGSKLL